MSKGLINIIAQGEIQVVSSREVSENFGKDHKNVISKIEQIISETTSAKNQANLFYESSYTDNCNREQKEYLITRDGFSLLAMGFTGAKALKWKLKYIDTFNKMEQALKEQQPSYMIGDPIERAKKWIEEQEQVKELIAQKDEVIEIQAPKVKVYDDFIDAEHSLGFRELRKQIEVALGITIKENDFKVIMRSKKLIGRTVKASAFAIRNGYAETKDVMDKYGNTRTQDRFTMKCRDMLVGHIKDIYSEEELIG